MSSETNPPPEKAEPDPPSVEAEPVGTALEVADGAPQAPPPAAATTGFPGLILLGVFAAILAVAGVVWLTRGEPRPAPEPSAEAAGEAPAPVTIEIPDAAPAPGGPHDAPGGAVNPSPDKIFNDAGSAKETLGEAPARAGSGEGFIDELPPAPHAAPGANDALRDAAKAALKNGAADDPGTDEPEPEAALPREDGRALAAAMGEARLALSFAALAARARSGAPYAAEIEAFLAEPQDKPLPAIVADRAATGVPTTAELARRFTEGHRAALAAGRRAEAKGAAAGVGASLYSLVNLRPAGPKAGEDTASVLSRVEDAALAGDLPRAIAEAASLNAEAAAALEPWLADARARVAVERALAERETSLLAAQRGGTL